MPEEASNWYVALIYSLASVFISVLLMLPVVILIFVFENLIPGPIQLALLVGALLAIWWGTKFTADLVQKKYLISDKQDIVNLSFFYFLFSIVLSFITLLLLSSLILLDAVIFFTVILLIFYFGSIRHIEEFEKTYRTPEEKLN
ncbi:MAG: hypothetical protein V5A57_00740 [Candidatus Paceibacterota bacterium]